MSATPQITQTRGPLPFFLQEFSYLLRSRRTYLLAGILLYALVGVPFVVKKPPPEIMTFVGKWFGQADLTLKLSLFIWTDIAMNKIAVLAGIVLAGGVVVDERARGSLQVFLSKPIPHSTYFLVKVTAASAVFALLYMLTVLLGLLYFPSNLPGFSAGKFLALSSVHLLAATFAVTFSGTMAIFFQRKLSAMIVSLMILFLLIGSAFIGFYNPNWVAFGYLNPFFHGVRLIGVLEHITVAQLLQPIVLLLVFHLAVLTLGFFRARHLGD
ncbi:MAG: ABC transporter permease subunit [Myxococcales bacterium]|nr:ABC transporter permease subunit [Myxococcales bacterium]